MRILIIDDGFLGKYIARELSTIYDGVDDEVVLVDRSAELVNEESDVVVDAAGSLASKPGAARLTVSVGVTPMADADVRFYLPAVVGTGMVGPVMTLARSINRGTFYHRCGDDRRVTLIHAIDIAKAIAMAVAGQIAPGGYWLTDGYEHTLTDLAEGLAYRLGQKRIYTLSERMYRYMSMIGLTKSIDFSGMNLPAGIAALIEAAPDWKPVNTVDYLKTHDYGDDDF